MSEKLISSKHSPGNTNGTPRWVYDDGDFIRKIIPYIAGPDLNFQNQADLINSLHPKKLIHDDWELSEKPEHTWKLKNGEKYNTFLHYKMTKVPYVFQLNENIPYLASKARRLTPLYTDLDLYNEHIFKKYIETNIKTFPYWNCDGGHGNIFQFDIGDWIIIDWDDCLLGNAHDSQSIGENLIRENVECVYDLFDSSTVKDYGKVIEFFNKTIDFYKKLTYNTVLEECEIDIKKVALETLENSRFKKDRRMIK
jgi:hypothetical protein